MGGGKLMLGTSGQHWPAFQLSLHWAARCGCPAAAPAAHGPEFTRPRRRQQLQSACAARLEALPQKREREST